MFSLLCLFLVSVAQTQRICIEGITSYAGPDPGQYWHCTRAGSPATLKQCPDGSRFNRKTGICLKASSQMLRAGAPHNVGEIEEREALGEIVNLGTLYNARTSALANGASLWSDRVIKAAQQVRNTVYSNVKVYMENSIVERIYTMDLSAHMRLEFLGGLISVGGSANYLRDEASKSDIARVTMNYHATTKTATIPVTTNLTFGELCNKIGENTGPTHVVTSVTYGMRSYFIFEKQVAITEYKEEIGGSLSIAINAVPSFTGEAAAEVNIDGSRAKTMENVRMKFYGDAIINEMPGSYNQTIEVFDQVNQQAKDSMTPIKYQLTPIGYFCDGVYDFINDINEEMVIKTTNILTELADLMKTVRTLLGRDPAIRFTSIRNQLLTFQGALKEYTNTITASISQLLPALKAGDADEEELLDIIYEHADSKFRKENAAIFLDNRAREIRTIELVTESANAANYVELSDIGAATDNKCIFSKKYATVYVLYVLPAADVAKAFLEDSLIDESAMWYNDLYRVGQAGAALGHFLTYAHINNADNHCMLIRLDNVTQSVHHDVELRLYESGVVLEEDFHAPPAPPAPTCTRNRYTGLDLETQPDTEPLSHVTAIRVSAVWSEGTGNDTRHYEVESDHPNQAHLVVLNLKPYTEFVVKTRYVIGEMGLSPWSHSINCTTAPTSAPVLPIVTEITTNSIALQWSEPQQRAVEGEVGYIVTASIDGKGQREIRTKDRSVTLDNLFSGNYYEISVRVEHDGVRSDAVILHSATLPLPPDAPLLESKNESYVELVVHSDRIKLPDKIVRDSLVVRYCEMDTKGDKPLYGSDRTFTVPVQEDGSFPPNMRIDNLDAGVKYAARIKLRVRVQGKLLETAESEAIIVTTDFSGEDFEGITSEVERYVDRTSHEIEELDAKVAELDGEIAQATTKIENTVKEIKYIAKHALTYAKLRLSTTDGLLTGLAQDSCIKRNVRISGTRVGSAIRHIDDPHRCLEICRGRDEAHSALYHHMPTSVAGECVCYKERFGSHFDTNAFTTSVNIMCYDVAGASSERWESCIRRKTAYGSSSLLQRVDRGMATIRECAMMCAEMDLCEIVQYNNADGTCLFYWSGNNEIDSQDEDLLTLACLYE